MNRSGALWLRNPKEVTTEEYADFYRSLVKVFRSLDGKPVWFDCRYLFHLPAKQLMHCNLLERANF